MPALQSSLIADRIVYDPNDRCSRPVTETLVEGTAYEILVPPQKLPGICAVPCSIIVAKEKVYITLTRALQRATAFPGHRF